MIFVNYRFGCDFCELCSAEISIPVGVSGPPSTSPVCVVSTVNLMSEVGWVDLHNLTDVFQQPFQLFREGDRTLLQVLYSTVYLHC